MTRGVIREEEYANKNLRPTFKSRRTTIGVWSCFYRNKIKPLYILPEEETMTTRRYK